MERSRPRDHGLQPCSRGRERSSTPIHWLLAHSRSVDRGGYECELDVVAYHPQTEHLLHVEPSLDADPWATREERFKKKFDAGRRYIKSSVFPWLARSKVPIEQVALLIASAKNHVEVGGGRVVNVDEFMSQMREKISAHGVMSANAIHEQFDLLRTVQLVVCGYYRVVPRSGSA